MDKQPTQEELSIIKEMSRPIGLIVLQWSYVERNMDYILKIIAEDYDRNNFINIKTLSPFASKKISLLHKCFNQLPSLTFVKKDGKSLMKRAETISKKRNQLIHSTFDGINPDGSINFLSLTRPKGELKYIFNRFVYTVPTLFDLEKKIEVLARDIGLFGLTLRPKKS